MKNKKVIIISIISIIITLAIGIFIRASETGILFDEIMMEYVHNKTTTLGISIMTKITYLGSVYFLLPVGGLIFILMVKKKNLEGIRLLVLSTIGSYGLNSMLKKIFIRARPLKYFLIEQEGYSFPSGHAMVSMSFYTTMTYLLVKNMSNQNAKKILWIINSIIVTSIGFSRIYLGVHWPTDILVGYLLGYIFYYSSTRIVKT